MRHSIDDMHIKKNVFESVIGILIDIKAKTKDGLMSWEDLVRLESRSELHPEDLGNGRHYLSTASYNLTNDEKRAICLSLKGLKVPTCFSSNIKRLVSMKDLTLTGFNAHDCNTPGVCHQLSNVLELKHDMLSGDDGVKIKST